MAQSDEEKAAFGRTIKNIRLQKGLRQQDVVDQSPHYTDVSAYRRVENGQRTPSRDVAIAILVYGLRVKDRQRIDSTIALAGYEALTAGEVADLKLSPDSPPAPDQKQATSPTRKAGPDSTLKRVWLAAAIMISLVLSAALCSITGFGAWLGLGLSAMYAALYVVSLLLETAFEPMARRSGVIAGIFCLTLIGSSIAISADAALVRLGRDGGLELALLTIALTALLQGFLARRTLPDYAVAKGNFQMHTAQSAHFKNTLYFLLAAVLFWLPPIHAVAILRRELRLGHGAFVQSAIGHGLLLGRGMVAPNYGWLIAALPAIIVASLFMRTQLLDNLKPQPHLNSFLQLFYVRATLYFVFCGVCVFWYTVAIGSLVG